MKQTILIITVFIAATIFQKTVTASSVSPQQSTQRTISKVTIIGNKLISTEALLIHVPYKSGEVFEQKECIKEIHNSFKQIAKVIIKGSLEGINKIGITIEITEKNPIKEIIIKGNRHIPLKEILKAIKAEEITALDEQELAMLGKTIKKLYTDKGYAKTEIATAIETVNNQNNAVFTISEGKRSTIRKINFSGNKSISDKNLRQAIISKEDWVLGFMDKSSTYHPERIMYGDTQMIEDLYINQGFLYAKVTDVTTFIDPKTFAIDLTFHIQEGLQYSIGSITMQDSPEISSEKLLSIIPLKTGMRYSRNAISQSIKTIERAWAQQGYLFSSAQPSIIPNENNQTVTVGFSYSKGEKVFVNRIDIVGNKKTRDKIIRRKIIVEEGDAITQTALDFSKNSVATLGFFDQKDGVNWKIKRINEKSANLELQLKERKTGNLSCSLGYGGSGTDIRSSGTGLNAKIDYSDINFLGNGIQSNLSASWARDEQTLVFRAAQPWMFDKPILGAIDLYHKRPTYDELRNLSTNVVKEKLTGGALTSGFIIQSNKYRTFQDTNVLFSLGMDHLAYQEHPRAAISFDDKNQVALLNQQFQSILDQAFHPGEFLWFSHNLEQDQRNHPMHPSQGHRWKFTTKVALPVLGSDIGFFKFSLDTHWYTTLIDELGLVFHVHALCGITKPFAKRIIPFGELFHIGGPATVRGFQFGQIGPRFLKTSTIGAEKTVVFNLELIFPITNDYSIKGVLFYDGGAGWGNPYIDDVNKDFVNGLHFDYRHSVGIGIRLLSPIPLKIDWGFKIDPRKDRLDSRKNELSSEVHFGMSYDL